MASCSPSALLEAAKYFSCLGPKELQMVIAQLLCDIQAAGGGGTCQNLSGELTDPTGLITPEWIGQIYVGPGYNWQATGLTSADWTMICPSSRYIFLDTTLDKFTLTYSDVVTEIHFPNLAGAITDFIVFQDTALQIVEAPLLAGAAGDLNFSGVSTLTSFNFDSLATVGNSIDFSGNTIMSSASFPALTDITNSSLTGSGCSLLTTISFPLLSVIGGNLDFSSCALTSVSFPSLTSIGAVAPGVPSCLFSDNPCTSASFASLVTSKAGMSFINCAALDTFSAPNWLPETADVITFTGCSLLAASVNHILARGVAGGMTSGSIDLSGGTSAAPTGQGILDKATLIGNGVLVTTN